MCGDDVGPEPLGVVIERLMLNLTGEIGAQLPTFDAGSVIPSDGSSAAGMVPPRLSPSGELDERAGTYRLSFAASGRKSEATVRDW